MPEGVPVTGTGVFLLLQAGWSRTSAQKTERISKLSSRFFFPLPPPVRHPSSAIPGTISQRPSIGPCQCPEAVDTGCAVVVMFNVVDCDPFCRLTVLFVKLHVAPVGRALQLNETLA